MRHLSPMLLVLCAPFVAACFQALDPDAASGGNEDPTSLETPPIELPGGGTTTSACESTSVQAMAILTADCASCHGGGSPGARQGQPPFDYVLDVAKLKLARSSSVTDPADPTQGMRFVVPGDPDDSRLYVRVAHGEMPPVLPVGVDPLPRPSVSDISLLNAWIAECVR